jgi:hypothetical protein
MVLLHKKGLGKFPGGNFRGHNTNFQEAPSVGALAFLNYEAVKKKLVLCPRNYKCCFSVTCYIMSCYLCKAI